MDLLLPLVLAAAAAVVEDAEGEPKGGGWGSVADCDWDCVGDLNENEALPVAAGPAPDPDPGGGPCVKPEPACAAPLVGCKMSRRRLLSSPSSCPPGPPLLCGRDSTVERKLDSISRPFALFPPDNPGHLDTRGGFGDYLAPIGTQVVDVYSLLYLDGGEGSGCLVFGGEWAGVSIVAVLVVWKPRAVAV